MYVRLATGQCIAHVLEKGRSHGADFFELHTPKLIECTRQLANDTQRFRSKRNRKTQRASFRNVLQYIENDELPPAIRVPFGMAQDERLELNTWSDRTLYVALLDTIGTNMNEHLKSNAMVRSVFDIKSANRLAPNVPHLSNRGLRYEKRSTAKRANYRKERSLKNCIDEEVGY